MKTTMKRIHLASVAIAAALITFAAFAEDKPAATAKPAETKSTETGKNYAPIAEARNKITACVADPAQMTEVMKSLSPEDQKTFLADVNAAISKLPGSVDDKTAKYLDINRAALNAVPKTEIGTVLAVTFATVPPESLTVISEQYAKDLFNRDADPSQKVADAQYEKMATEIVGKVEKETSGSDDAGVRNTLAVLMFVKADNGKIEDLANTLVETIPDAATRKLAKEEWIPAATKGETPSYDAMLAYADAGKAPNLDIVLHLANPQILDAVNVDIVSGMDNAAGIQTTPVLDQAFGGFDDASAYIVEQSDSTTATSAVNGGGETARSASPLAPWNPEYDRGSIDTTKEVIVEVIEEIVKEQSEPEPYPFSTL